MSEECLKDEELQVAVELEEDFVAEDVDGWKKQKDGKAEEVK